MKKKLTSILAIVLALVLGYFGINQSVLPQETDTTPTTQTATVPGQTTAPIETTLPEDTVLPEETTAPADTTPYLDPDGSYTTKEDVALYIHIYGRLPVNFMTKNEARKLGWEGGGLDRYAPGMCIGGDKFGNYEKILPDAPGRKWTECDIDTLGATSRGAKRIVFSNDGLIYYTDDHYETFELLYGEE